MTQFSPVYTAAQARHGSAFSARRFPRQAFNNLIDPVLAIDWFEMRDPTFPPHPHSGFSAVTYLFADSENGFINRDSFGDVQDIHPGGLHWSRAARGMMHEEVPMPGKGMAHGLQIFVNLPAANQSDPAGAYAVPPAKVRLHSGAGWTSRVAVDGTSLGGTENALPSPIRIEEVALDADASRTIGVSAGWGGILIALEGDLSINGTALTIGQAIGFSAEQDDHFDVVTTGQEARFIVIDGAQLKQPIYAHGPLMTASEASLEKAYHYVSSLTLPA